MSLKKCFFNHSLLVILLLLLPNFQHWKTVEWITCSVYFLFCVTHYLNTGFVPFKLSSFDSKFLVKTSDNDVTFSGTSILRNVWVSINLHICIERFRFCMSAIRVNYFSCYIICGMWHAELLKIYINWKFIWFCAATVSIIWQTFDWLLIISTDQILLKRLFMNMHKIRRIIIFTL